MVSLIRYSQATTTTIITCFALARRSSSFAVVPTTTSFISSIKNTNPTRYSRLGHSRTHNVLFSSSSLRSSNNDDSATMTTKKKVLVPIADGSEEIETTCITDTLVRFGADVTIASVKPDSDLICTMSRGIKVMADCTIADAISNTDYDMIILPGGMPGAEHLRDCSPLIELLRKQKDAGKWYGAICAAPAIALQPNGLLDDTMNATCYPAPHFRAAISKHFTSDDDVVISKNCITSKGPGTALQFALSLGEVLYGKEKRDEIAKGMLVE